jgi:hypothetical protein
VELFRRNIEVWRYNALKGDVICQLLGYSIVAIQQQQPIVIAAPIKKIFRDD